MRRYRNNSASKTAVATALIVAFCAVASPAGAYLPESVQVFSLLYSAHGNTRGIYVKQRVRFISHGEVESVQPSTQELYLKAPGKLYARLSGSEKERIVVQNGSEVCMKPDSGSTWVLRSLPYLFLFQTPATGMGMFRFWGMATRRISLDLAGGSPAYLIGAWKRNDTDGTPRLWVDKKNGYPLRYQETNPSGKLLRLEFSGYDPGRWKYAFPGVIEIFVDGVLQTRCQTEEVLKMDLIPDMYFDFSRISQPPPRVK